MRRVSSTEARRDWSKLLAAVEAGKEVVITRYGRPVARLAPASEKGRAPDLAAFRACIAPLQMSIKELIRLERDDYRY